MISKKKLCLLALSAGFTLSINASEGVTLGDSQPLSFEQVKSVLKGAPISLSLDRMAKAEKAVIRGASLSPVYGVNRALGANFKESIPLSYGRDSLEISAYSKSVSTYANLNFLGSNDVSSDPELYACSKNSQVSPQAYADARAVALVALSRMAKGSMGTSVTMAERVASMLNQGVLPMVPSLQYGDSLGSGDAVPMAAWLRSVYDYEGKNINLPHAQDPSAAGYPTNKTGCFVGKDSSQSLTKEAVNTLFPSSAFGGADAVSVLTSNAYTIGMLVQMLVQYEAVFESMFEERSESSVSSKDLSASNMENYRAALQGLREAVMLFVNSSGGSTFVVPELVNVDVGSGVGSAAALAASFDDTTAVAGSLERFMLYFGTAAINKFKDYSIVNRGKLIPKIRSLMQPVNKGETIDSHVGDHAPYTTNLALNFSEMIKVVSLGEKYEFENYSRSDLENVFSVSLTLNGVERDLEGALSAGLSVDRNNALQSFRRSLDMKTSGDREDLMKQISILRDLTVLGGYSFRALRDYELAVFDGPKYLSIHPRNYGVAQYERVMAFHLDKIRSLAQVAGMVNVEGFSADYSALTEVAKDAVNDALEHYTVLAAGELIVAAQLTEVGGKYSAFNLTGYLLGLMDGSRSKPYKAFYNTLRNSVPFVEWDAGSVEGNDGSRMSHQLSTLTGKIKAGDYRHDVFGYSEDSESGTESTENIESIESIDRLGSFDKSVKTLLNDCTVTACSEALANINVILETMKTEGERVEYTNRLNDLKFMLSLKIPNTQNRVKSIRYLGATPLALPYKSLEMRSYTDLKDASSGVSRNSAGKAYQDVVALVDLMRATPPQRVTAEKANREADLAYRALKKIEKDIINVIGLSFAAKNANSMAYDKDVRFRANDHKYGWVPVTDTMNRVAKKLTKAIDSTSYINRSTNKAYPTLSVENPQHRGMQDNRSFRDIVPILADYVDAVQVLKSGDASNVDYQRVNLVLDRLALQTWTRIQALFYQNDLHDVGLHFDVDSLFHTDANNGSSTVMSALFLETVESIRGLAQIKDLSSDNAVNVYYTAVSIQESIGLLKKLFGMEALVAKNMIEVRRQYFSDYGKINMGSSGTSQVFNAIRKSRSCSMTKQLAYQDFAKCSNAVIFQNSH